MSTEIEMEKGSIEYLYADVTSDIALDQQAVEIAIAPTVQTAVWLTAAWTGDAGNDRTCRVLLDGTLAAGKYMIFVKIHDNPEIPIIKAGSLKVKVN